MDTGILGVCLDLWNTIATTRQDPHPLAILAEAFGLEGRAGWRRVLEEAMMTRPLSGITEGLAAIERATGRAPGEERASFFRKAVVGDWRNHLSDHAAEETMRRAEEILAREFEPGRGASAHAPPVTANAA